MDVARQKLEKHRERALKGGESAASYAHGLGISPQRIAKLIAGRTEPTLREAYTLKAAAKIKPDLWLD